MCSHDFESCCENSDTVLLIVDLQQAWSATNWAMHEDSPTSFRPQQRFCQWYHAGVPDDSSWWGKGKQGRSFVVVVVVAVVRLSRDLPHRRVSFPSERTGSLTDSKNEPPSLKYIQTH